MADSASQESQARQVAAVEGLRLADAAKAPLSEGVTTASIAAFSAARFRVEDTQSEPGVIDFRARLMKMGQ